MNAATHQQPAPTQCAQSREVLPHAHALCVCAGYVNITPDLEARIEQGVRTYGVPLTPHNGRDQAVDALQELADAAVYLAAAYVEAPIRNGIEDSDKNSTWADTEERALLRWAIKKISEAEELIKDATVWRAKRIAAEAQPTDLERLLRHEAENESEVQP